MGGGGIDGGTGGSARGAMEFGGSDGCEIDSGNLSDDFTLDIALFWETECGGADGECAGDTSGTSGDANNGDGGGGGLGVGAGGAGDCVGGVADSEMDK